MQSDKNTQLRGRDIRLETIYSKPQELGSRRKLSWLTYANKKLCHPEKNSWDHDIYAHSQLKHIEQVGKIINSCN